VRGGGDQGAERAPAGGGVAKGVTVPGADFRYEERVVALIDILGFSALVKASASSPAAQSRAGQLIRVNELFSKFLEFVPLAQGSFFSDTFVFSMQSPTNNIVYVVREIGYLCQYLLMQGLPCRGAISVGPLYHNGAYVIGPSLVRAHELETSRAIYPRVIFDENALEYWERDVREGSSVEILAPLVKKDDDGFHFIDIFSKIFPTNFYQWTDFIESFPPLPAHNDFIAQAKDFTEQAIKEHTHDERISDKYKWLLQKISEHASH
jgi:hypothetical protein